MASKAQAVQLNYELLHWSLHCGHEQPPVTGDLVLCPGLLSTASASSALLLLLLVLLISCECWSQRAGQGSCTVSSHVVSDLCFGFSLPSIQRDPPQSWGVTPVQVRTGRLILQV